MPVYNPFLKGLSVSRLSGYLKCRQFAKLSNEGWNSLRTPGVIQFGEIAHAVLESFYQESRKSPPKESEVLERIGEQVEKWEASSRGQRASAEELKQLEVNAVLLEAVLPSYFKFWGKEDFGELQWLCLEKEFFFQFEGFNLRVKMDGVYRKNGVWILETKTKGRVEEQSMEDLLAVDLQSKYYVLGTENVFKEMPKGIRYNIVRRPGHKLGKKETLQAFKERVRKEVILDPAHYFIRYKVSVSTSDHLTFKKELKLMLQEYKDWIEGKIPTFKNPCSCMDRHGTCRYLRICASNDYNGFYKTDFGASKKIAIRRA